MHVHIETPRLLIREMTLADGDVIYQYAQSPLYRRYEPDAPRTPDEWASIMQWIIESQHDQPRAYHYVAIARKETPDVIIGSVHISVRDFTHRQAEVGYAFNPVVWGRGYTTEACRAMVDFAFQQLFMHRVYAADIVSENIASIRVAEKLGMRREGHFRHALYFQERWWDTLTYGICADEWGTPQE